MTAPAGKQGPNFLLYAFIGISLAVHVVLIFQWIDWESTEPEVPIEIEIGETASRPARTAPRPPSVPRMPEPLLADPDIRAEIPDASSVDPVPDVVPPRALPPVPHVDARLPIAEWPEESRPDPENSETQSDYFARVQQALEKGKQYPASARQRRLEGEVVLKFTIGRDGAISGLTIIKGSRFSSLDEAALAAVRSAAPFPPLPADLFDGPLELNVPIRFEIKD